VTSRLSRRSLFTGLTSASGLIGCYSASEARERHVSGLVLRLSPPRVVDLNSTAEQAIDIAHEGSARPSAEKVVLVDVIQDQPAVDTSALRWAAGYPVYDEAASTSRMARVLLRFAVPAGVPVTGRARILFEVPAGPAGTSL
jgi:hypothetical protein